MTTEFKTWEELSELEQLEITYCEMHKDAYGVKARWYRAESVEQARADIASLSLAVDAAIARERAAEQEAITNFEALVGKTMSMGAKTRESALRWIMDGSRCNSDWEFLCYEYGLPYGYFKQAA